MMRVRRDGKQGLRPAVEGVQGVDWTLAGTVPADLRQRRERAEQPRKSLNPASDQRQLVSPAAEPEIRDAERDAEGEIHRRIV